MSSTETMERNAGPTEAVTISPRERILATAGPLFYREGYRAVGVDRLIAESGVAKATFYKHFPAKDDLIVAWIERAAAFGKSLENRVATGTAPLLAVVDAYIDIANREECLGCTFQGTAAEFPEEAHPAHAASLRVKRRVLARFSELAETEGHTEPQKIAQMLYLLLEGVWATTRMFRNAAPIGFAKEAARKLIA